MINNTTIAWWFGRLTWIMLLCMPVLTGWTQDKRITGWVKDTAGNPVAGASISLFNVKDTGIVKLSVADSSGRYVITDLWAGNYRVLVSAVGFVQKSSNVLELSDSITELFVDTMVLAFTKSMLQGVVVTAVKPPVELRADRMVLNVSNSVNAIGSSAIELLRKAPGVRVDNDNNISVNGKNRVVVFIDGRPSNLSGSDLGSVLSAMPSSDIDIIEVITNPSARYDASGAAIINIKLKKNKMFGFNGSVSGTGSFGYSPKTDLSANLNFRKQLFNIYGNYSYSLGQSKTTADFLREQQAAGKPVNFSQSSINLKGNNNHNFKTGIDVFLNKRNTIGVIVNGGTANNDYNTFSNTHIAYVANGSDSVLVATNDQPNRNHRFSYNLNYRYADTLGKEFNLDADYGTFNKTAESYQLNTYFNSHAAAVVENNYRNNIATDINYFALKADYEQNAWGGKVGAGLKYGDVKTGNDFRFYNIINGSDVVNKDRTSSFSYHEKVAAGYINYNRSFKKWSVQTGVRIEHTDVKSGLQALNNASVAGDTSYINFFPNLSVNYRISDESNAGISYSRRLDRPSYEDLNPFEVLLDELTYNKGNSFLKPQYTDNIQWAYSLKRFSLSMSYGHTRNYIANVLDTVDGIKSYQTIWNIHAKRVLSMNAFYMLTCTKWWSIILSTGAFKSRFNGSINNSYLDISAFSMNFYNEHDFTLSKGLTMQVSGFLNTPGVEGIFKTKMMGSMDFGVQKTFFKDAGVLKCRVSDVFNSLRYASTTGFSGLYLNSHVKWDSRRVIVSMVYRFGNRNVKAERERKTSSEEERKRIRN